jgi:hypothetical protein
MSQAPKHVPSRLEIWRPSILRPGVHICKIGDIKCQEVHDTRDESKARCKELNRARVVDYHYGLERSMQ